MIKNRLKQIRMAEYIEEPKEFAKRLGVNVKTYYTWESGTTIPGSKTMFEVAKKLNKKVDDIWWLE